MGVADTGKTDYCCITYTQTSGTCLEDSQIGCDAGFGFNCGGTDKPSDSNPSLTCGAATPGPNSSSNYCCH
jgi:hypothetical protein